MRIKGDYLPIGSIVHTDGIDAPVLIIGKLQYNGDEKATPQNLKQERL